MSKNFSPLRRGLEVRRAIGVYLYLFNKKSYCNNKINLKKKEHSRKKE